MELSLHILLLSLVEGLTEFLPISSTAHLLLLSDILNFNEIPNKIFEVVIQLGAILPVIIIYRQKLLNVALSLHSNHQSRVFLFNLFISFLPIAILGLLFHSFIKEVLFSIEVLAISMIVGGVVFLFTDHITERGKTIDNITYKQAGFIGLIQALAIIPGVSRAGASIIGSLLVGMNKKEAVEYSFFLALPTIFAASVYDLYKNWEGLTFNQLTIIALGFIASFIASYIVVMFLVKFVDKFGLKHFGYYRIAFGALVLLFYL